MPATTIQFSPSSRARLTAYDLGRFPTARLFDRIGRAVCDAGCLPRKELYESWEVARRARRWLRGGRVIDLGAGHGLLAQIMLLLDDSSPHAVVVDAALPRSAPRIREALARGWPRLAGRVSLVTGGPEAIRVRAGDVVVSCHACGAFTDRVIACAVTARARVAVLPCCHETETCDTGDLGGWLDSALAIDVTRVARLKAHGYRVRTQMISLEITPKNRLILGDPA